MKSRVRHIAGLSGVALAVLLALPAQAADKELLDILLANGAITKEQYHQLSRRDYSKITKEKAEQADEIKAAVQENVPPWVNGMKWTGDFRIRHDWQGFDQNTDPSKVDRTRERMRARFGFTYDVNPATQLGVMLASGEGEAVSTNSTLNDRFGAKTIWLDQAYVKHNFMDKAMTVYAGKFTNPFKTASSLIFDPDLRFEGAAAQYEFSNGAFVNGGVFPLDESSSAAADPYLIGLQAGYKHEVGNDYPWNASIGYYVYDDTSRISLNAPLECKSVATTPTSTNCTAKDFAGGNTETRFKVVNPNFTVGIRSLPVYTALYGEYVHNTAATTDANGWLLGTRFGKEKIKDYLDWQGFVQYSRLEANASYDDFAESDFHSGGTNNKGWILGYKLGLDKGWEHDLTWYQSHEIKDQASMHNGEKRVQVDLSYKF